MKGFYFLCICFTFLIVISLDPDIPSHSPPCPFIVLCTEESGISEPILYQRYIPIVPIYEVLLAHCRMSP